MLQYIFLTALLMTAPIVTPQVTPQAPKETVLGSAMQVDFYSVPRIDKQGVSYGVDVFARNHNDTPMQVMTELRDGVNVQNQLQTGWFTIPPQGQLYLGALIQEDMKKPWSYELTWTVQP